MRCHGEVERLDGALASSSSSRAEAGFRLRLRHVLEVLGRGPCFELGFSSVAAYALERCDWSVRWVEGARCLARRLEALPELRRAMAFGSVSWSMGELLARVAQRHDEARWIEEEEPGSAPRRAWLVMLGSLAGWLEGGLQMSAARGRAPASNVGSKGRLGIRLRVSRVNAAWWHELEAQARRWLPSGTSWLRFLCLSLWNAWRHLLGTSVAYGHIYIRDRYRCTSPVCSRRDVTPHHLQFRSAGGSDEPKNTTSVCTWRHLFGVHGGRIRAVGTADHIRWELGTPGRPCLVVDGRERVAA